AEVIPDARHEPEARLGAEPCGREAHDPDPAAQEKAPGRLGIVVDRHRRVPSRQRRSALALGPAVRLATQQQVGAQRSPELEVPAHRALAACAPIAREPQRSPAEPEADPESLARLWMLRRSLTRYAGRQEAD